MVDYSTLALIIIDSIEKTLQMVHKKQNLKMKTSEISQVPVDEINEVILH
jgi:hypothetical protein